MNDRPSAAGHADQPARRTLSHVTTRMTTVVPI
jgi:hypothetical protein